MSVFLRSLPIAHSPAILWVVVIALLLAAPMSADAQERISILGHSGALAQADTDAADDDTAGSEGGEEGEQGEAQTSSSLQRGGRMEFDARVIRGERAGSGAVFLFQRPPRPLPSMIERRTSYLQGTVHRVFGKDGVDRLEQSREAE